MDNTHEHDSNQTAADGTHPERRRPRWGQVSANTADHFENLGGHENSGNNGYVEVLRHADPDTSWRRVARWALRARAEGVV
jgi:hypothetical protein